MYRNPVYMYIYRFFRDGVSEFKPQTQKRKEKKVNEEKVNKMIILLASGEYPLEDALDQALDRVIEEIHSEE